MGIDKATKNVINFLNMNDLENYKEIVEKIYGIGTTTFDVNANHTNNIIGALNNSVHHEFQRCFIARLNRLSAFYEKNDSNKKHLIDKINLLASESDNNWRGAYAELVASDFLNKDLLEQKNSLSEPITLNYDIDNNRTFAKELGYSKANLDGYFQDYDVYVDIKCLKDNVTEILEGIYAEVKKRLNRSDFLISAEYPIDMHYDEIKEKRENLINELCNQIDTKQKISYIKSSVISNLNFRLLWKNGILITEKTYNPYKHAEENYKLIFVHTRKFVKDRPFFLVFVSFPWSNGSIVVFNELNKEFYRALSRRAFCQYLHSDKLYNSMSSKFVGNDTIFDVTKKISGILFLENWSIQSDTPNNHNIKSYFYFNPNADNKLSDSPLKEYFRSLVDNFDDFQYDNY